MKLFITPYRWNKRPAPYTEELHPRLWDIRDAAGCEIARVSIRDDSDYEHANALAISRVPKMLALLVRVSAVMDQDEPLAIEARALLEGLVEE